jgi:small subunit ribosomal protein S21
LHASKSGLKGVIRLSEVKIGENDSFETALKRFNRKLQQDGILAEARRREHFEKPSVKRKRKEAAKRRKADAKLYARDNN